MTQRGKVEKMTEKESIKFVQCNVATKYSPAFYMITVDGEPLGHPITEEQAKFMLDWFDSVMFEWNDELMQWDKF